MALVVLIAAILTVGFAKLMAMSVNWLCAHRQAKKIVFADKSLNFCLVLAYPIVLSYLLAAGSAESSIHIENVGAAAWFLMVLGAIGLLFLGRSTVGYWSYRPPACEISVDSTIIDLRHSEANWRIEFVGSRGRIRQLALLPGNEQLTIDVSTKTYSLPRLPEEWNGLSIVQLTDLHFYRGMTRRYFEVVCQHAADLKPDLFVFTGDLLDDQSLLKWLPETLGRLMAPLGCYFILGNHDWYLDPAATRNEFLRLGWIDVANRFVTVTSSDSSRRPLVVCGDETPWMGVHPDLWGAPSECFRILFSHSPDSINWARRNQIDLMLAGHTHGGQIRLPILGPVYSPSRYGCRFSAGVFWLDPTLMYVSRGVSGKEPIRYYCRPEVTKLVLKRTSRESHPTEPVSVVNRLSG